MPNLFARKSLDKVMGDMESGERLKRVLGPVALTALGIGAIIGTGIFVLVGKAARDVTGPALMLSFVFAGLACIFSALCYAEFASMAPVAGSAYTYAYLTLGELMAWIIGWDLVLEYAVASCTVAHGWSKYFQDLLNQFQIPLPKAIINAPFDIHEGQFVSTGSVLDLPAVVISAIITAILIRGIRESAFFNGLMVVIKLAVVLFVIFAGIPYIAVSNWTDNFAPYGYGGLSFFGTLVWGETNPETKLPAGVLAGAALIFFAYLGFDAVSTNAEEAKNPKRDLPIGIIGSLLVCTVLYIAVAAVLTGMVPYKEIPKEAPVAGVFAQVGFPGARLLISIGALTGITSVLLVMMCGQPRIFLAMARDGLLPASFFAKIHPIYKTPYLSTILTGLVVALGGSLLPLDVLAELTNIGTLFAFVVVCAAVLVLRVINPDAERAFKVPFGVFTPIAGIAMCLVLMFSLGWENWMRLFIWLGLGLVIYFCYGVWHSRLQKEISAGAK